MRKRGPTGGMDYDRMRDMFNGMNDEEIATDIKRTVDEAEANRRLELGGAEVPLFGCAEKLLIYYFIGLAGFIGVVKGCNLDEKYNWGEEKPTQEVRREY